MMHTKEKPILLFASIISALNGYIRENNSKVITDESNRQQDIKAIAKIVYEYYHLPKERIDQLLLITDSGLNDSGLLPLPQALGLNDQTINVLRFNAAIASINRCLTKMNTGSLILNVIYKREHSDLRSKVIEAMKSHEEMSKALARDQVFAWVAPQLDSTHLAKLSTVSLTLNAAVKSNNELWKKHAQETLHVSIDRFKLRIESPAQSFSRLAKAKKIRAYFTLFYSKEDSPISHLVQKEFVAAFSACLRSPYLFKGSLTTYKSYSILITETKQAAQQQLSDTKATCIGAQICLRKQPDYHFVPLAHKIEKLEVWRSSQPSVTTLAVPVSYDATAKELNIQPTLGPGPFRV